MSRIVILFALIGASVWAAIWLADLQGHVRIETAGYIVDSPAIGLVVLAVVAIAVFVVLLYRLWRVFGGAPRRYLAYRNSNRRQRGYQALTQGMVAVAAGDPREARRSARKADALLNDPPLTMLLSAQAAQLEGDEDAARRYFEAMLDEPEMAFLGVRGLLMQATRRGDKVEALQLASRAHELRPDTPWVLRRLLDLQVNAGQWDAADETLRRALRVGAIAAEDARRQRSALAVEASREAAANGDLPVATVRARQAHDLDPASVPATVVHAQRLVEAGKPRRAAKTIETAWRKQPHPDLAEAFRVLGGKDEPPLERVKRFQRLFSVRPDHAESHIALAEASLAAQLWGEARTHLEQAGATAKSTRLLRLMADLEEQEHGDLKAARHWLDEAATAPSEHAWYCSDCGSVAGEWRACCDSCGGFATLEWRLPPGLSAPQVMPALTGPEVPS